MTDERPPESEGPPTGSAPTEGAAPADEQPASTEPAPAPTGSAPQPPEEPAAAAEPEAPKEEPAAPAVPNNTPDQGETRQGSEEPAPAAPVPPSVKDEPAASPAPDAPAPADPIAAASVGAPVGDAPPPPPPAKDAAKPRPKRPPRPREPLPWPELRAVAAMARDGVEVEDLKELFRLLPNDVRDETVDGVREYRKGARRPVSAHAGKSLARAVHTARRARRRPDSDEAVSDAIGQALAAEVIASLDVEVAAEVILPKRDLLERESRNARRRQKAEDDKTRDERRRRAREESGQQGTKDGTYSGAKIRGLDQLSKLFDDDK